MSRLSGGICRCLQHTAPSGFPLFLCSLSCILEWLLLPSSQYQRSSGLSPLLLTVTYLPGSHFLFSFGSQNLGFASSSSNSKFPAGLLFLNVRVANSARLNILQKVIDINTFLPPTCSNSSGLMAAPVVPNHL